MKKLRFLLIISAAITLTAMTFSCKQAKTEQVGNKASDALVSEAKFAATKLVAAVNSSMGKDEYKVFDTKVVYCSDSLCILHLKVGNDEKTATPNEYCYLAYKQKKYEHLSYPGSVYMSEEDYKKSDNSKSYDEIIFRKAVEAINRSGNLVGEPFKKIEDKIALSNEMGNWSIADYVDDFGDKDGGHFLVLIGSGVFSNTATTNSPLKVVFSHDARRNMFWFKLMEYNRTLIRDNNIYRFKIKDSAGKYGEVSLYCNDSGTMELTLEKDSAAFAMVLKGVLKDGEMSFNVHRESELANEYKFKLNVSGFNEAVKTLYGIDLKKSLAKYLDE